MCLTKKIYLFTIIYQTLVCFDNNQKRHILKPQRDYLPLSNFRGKGVQILCNAVFAIT